MNFCRRCGSKLTQLNAHTFTCENSHTIYQNPAPTAGLILFTRESQAILAVRAHEPGKGLLDSIGGFLDGNESYEDALKREIKEEVGLEPGDYTNPEIIMSAKGTYRFGNETVPIASVFYKSTLLSPDKLVPHDDVADIYTAYLEDIDLDQIAGIDVRQCIEHLQRKGSGRCQNLK